MRILDSRPGQPEKRDSDLQPGAGDLILFSPDKNRIHHVIDERSSLTVCPANPRFASATSLSRCMIGKMPKYSTFPARGFQRTLRQVFSSREKMSGTPVEGEMYFPKGGIPLFRRGPG
jgi:hypothetical protein